MPNIKDGAFSDEGVIVSGLTDDPIIKIKVEDNRTHISSFGEAITVCSRYHLGKLIKELKSIHEQIT